MGPGLRIPMIVLATAALAFVGRDICHAIDALTPLAAGPSPYFVAAHAGLLYLWAPVVAIAASALFLAPGLLVALGAGAAEERFELWLLKGTVLSVFAVPLAAALAQAATGVEIAGGAYVALLLALCLPGLWLVAGRPVAPVLRGRSWELAAMIGLPFAVLVLMAPKFYWENLNDDGAHSFLNALLFIERGLPFWPPGDSSITGYPSTTMMTETFLQTGMVRFFGPYESALRFAYLPGVAVLAGVILGVVRAAGEAGRAAVALGVAAQLLLFSFVMAFNPTYSPYFADIALPMTREPLIFLGFLGAVLFFQERRHAWMAAVSCLGLLSAPNGILLILFFLAAHFILTRPLPWKEVVVAGAITVGIVVLATLAMVLLDRLGITQRSGEFGSDGILRRLRFVTLVDTQRLLFWVLPAGILPALSLIAWRWQDPLSRRLTLTAAIYVLFFYVQAYRILPHHFAPAVLLPVVVFWRLRPVRSAPLAGLALGLAGVAAALALSWPDTLRPNSHNRDFGQRIVLQTPINPFANPDLLGTYLKLMTGAFPPSWTDETLAAAYNPEPTAAFVYATRPKPEGAAPDYAVRPETVPLAPGEVVLGAPVAGTVLVARDAAVYARDRQAADQPVSVARAFRVPRERIFGHGTHDKTRVIWDLARIAGMR